MSEKHGGPAFPSLEKVEQFDDDRGQYVAFHLPVGGMTLRDYFAAHAMQAMVTKSSGQDSTGGAKGVPLIAKYAYEFADAMLKEREK